jgi:hypothetical protein
MPYALKWGKRGKRERNKINICDYYMKSGILREENILLVSLWDAFSFFMAGYTSVRGVSKEISLYGPFLVVHFSS